jgi:glucose/arabinose dehydrogenase/PKD repeat protein
MLPTRAVAVALAFFVAAPALAITLPSQFVSENAVPGVTFNTPTAIAFLPDGRMLVCEKRGVIYVVVNGVRQSTPMWDRQAEVLNQHDRGFLGLAVDPNFESNRYLYMLYTVDPDSNGVDDNDDAFGRLVRYQTSTSNPNVVDAGSRTVLIGHNWRAGIPIGSPSHTIGDLQFGADGSLLVSCGDGAQFNTMDHGGYDPNLFGPTRTDPYEDIGAFRAQYLGSLAGKLLRVNPTNGHGYSSNPFYDGDPTSNRSRVFHYGVRNPFRFTVRPGTGSTDPTAGNPGVLYIGDVGWATWEDHIIAPSGGKNFGWPCYEGMGTQPSYQVGSPSHHDCSTIGTPENPVLHSPPFMTTHHSNASLSVPSGLIGNCAVGGVFYTGNRYPTQYRNQYFFADYGQSWIRVAQVSANDQFQQLLGFATSADAPVNLELEPGTGDIMYVSISTGEVRRIRYTGTVQDNNPPVATASATPSSGPAPLDVQLSSAGSSDPDGDPLTFAWAFGDGGTSSFANPTHTYQDPGTYSAVLSVTDGRGGLTRDTVVVTATGAPVNTPPVAVITSPADGSFYVDGSTIAMAGSATDGQDPAGALDYQWQVDLHHNTHVHPSSITASGTSASFVADNHDDGTGVWFRILFKVSDTGGLVDTAAVSIFPEVDLAPSAITVTPASPDNTMPLTYALDVTNNGRMPAPLTRWRLLVDGGVIAEGDVQVAALSSVPVTVNGPALAAGSHGLQVVADALGVATETSESNNSSARSINVALYRPPFPAAGVLDAFNRANGALTGSWSQSALGIASNALVPTAKNGNGWGVWTGGTYGPNQEAWVTLSALSTKCPEHDLLLKLQGTTDADAHVQVRYDHQKKRITVSTVAPGGAIQSRGTTAMTYAGGQRFGARAYSDGTVDVYRDAAVVATYSVAGWTYAGSGGRLGVELVRGSGSRLDDFGGGTVAGALVAGLEAAGTTGIASWIHDVEGDAAEGASEGMTPADADGAPALPGDIVLGLARPNPAPSGVHMALELPARTPVEMTILDLQGRAVWHQPERVYGAGRWDLSWNGTSPTGERARPGLYLAKVRVDGTEFVRRFMLVR